MSSNLPPMPVPPDSDEPSYGMPSGNPPMWGPDPHKSKAWGMALNWMDIWKKVLTQPGVSTFHEILSDPQATVNRAYTWLFLVGVFAGAISMLGSGGFAAAESDNSNGAECFIVCCAPFFGALFVLGSIINVGIQNFIARMLGGRGTYDHLLYSYASYEAPITVLSIIPCVGFFLMLYSIILNITAVEAVHQIGWLKATLTVFWFISLFCLCGLLVFMLIIAGASSSSVLLPGF